MKQIKSAVLLAIGVIIGLVIFNGWAEIRKNRAIYEAITDAGLCVIFKNGGAEIIPCSGYCDPRVNKFCSVLRHKNTEAKK